MIYSDIENYDLGPLGTFLRDMAGASIQTDEGVEDLVREAAGLPERLDDYGTSLPNVQRGKPAAGKQPPKDNEPPDDEEAVKRASRWMSAQPLSCTFISNAWRARPSARKSRNLDRRINRKTPNSVLWFVEYTKKGGKNLCQQTQKISKL